MATCTYWARSNADNLTCRGMWAPPIKTPGVWIASLYSSSSSMCLFFASFLFFCFSCALCCGRYQADSGSSPFVVTLEKERELLRSQHSNGSCDVTHHRSSHHLPTATSLQLGCFFLANFCSGRSACSSSSPRWSWYGTRWGIVPTRVSVVNDRIRTGRKAASHSTSAGRCTYRVLLGRSARHSPTVPVDGATAYCLAGL